LGENETAPPDLFIELIRYAYRKLALEPKEVVIKNPEASDKELQAVKAANSRLLEALNDAEKARTEFMGLPLPSTEKKCITLLEGFYDILMDLSPTIAAQYYLRLKEFIETRNLRYTLAPDCKIRLSLTGLLVSQYSTLRKSAIRLSNQHSNPDVTRLDTLKELEAKVGHISDDFAEKECVRVISNLLEEIARSKTGFVKGKETLGTSLGKLPTLFAHETFLLNLSGFYDFACDYPILRHPGRQAKKIRDLTKEDAILTIWLGLMYASFIAEQDAFNIIQLGDI
jgi:hypothetical protein